MGNGRYGDHDEGIQVEDIVVRDRGNGIGKRRMGYSGRYGGDLPPRREDRDIVSHVRLDVETEVLCSIAEGTAGIRGVAGGVLVVGGPESSISAGRGFTG